MDFKCEKPSTEGFSLVNYYLPYFTLIIFCLSVLLFCEMVIK